MNIKSVSLIILAIAGLTACATIVQVRPIASGHHITSVAIRENKKVALDDFLPVLISGFARHGINAKVISEDADPRNEYIVSYVAFRHWDFAPYLADATVRIERNGDLLGYAEYHMQAGGAWAIDKWKSTKSKMDPVIDQLLQNVNVPAPVAGSSGGAHAIQ